MIKPVLDINEVIALYEEHKNLHKIGKILHTSHLRLSQMLKDANYAIQNIGKRNDNIPKEELNSIIEDYTNGAGIYLLCEKYHMGKIRLKRILKSNGIEIRPKGNQPLETKYLVKDYKIPKYLPIEKHHYVAIHRETKQEFADYMNQGGHLTSYIKNVDNVKVPTLYDRRKYYMATGNYWWEQYFDIVSVPNDQVKKCPYCNWETKDIENKSGALTTHIQTKHHISIVDHLRNHPEDTEYFTLVDKNLNRSRELDESRYVICKICGKKLSRIENQHLKKHGINKEEYINRFGNEDLVCEDLHNKLSQIVIEQNMNIDLDKLPSKFTSKAESEIVDYIKSQGISCKKNRSILKGKELDILIKDKELAIEYNGNKWHTEDFGLKDSKFHLNKTIGCENQNIQLIQIFEDEYTNKKDVILNSLSHKLKCNQNRIRIQGRKCHINEIDVNTTIDFIKQFNIGEYKSSDVNLGAFYKEELVAIISFKNIKDTTWQLTNLTSNYNYICQGICGKLFNHFIKHYKPSKIISFADRRFVTQIKENIYTKLGFELKEIIPPQYKYYIPSVKRLDRISEDELKTLNIKEDTHIDKIWDCGYLQYEKVVNK